MDVSPSELAELKSVFKAECEEHLAALDTLLLKLEQAPHHTPTLQETFRRVHSIKGAARMVGYAGLELLAHTLEAILANARDGKQLLTPPLIAALFEGVDAIGDLLRSDTGRSEGEARVRAALERVGMLTGATGASVTMLDRSAYAPPEITQPQGGDVIRVSAHKIDGLLAAPSELLREHASEERELKELNGLLDGVFDAVDSVRAHQDQQRRLAALEHAVSVAGKRRDHARVLLNRIAERNLRRSRSLEELRHGLAGLGMLPVQTILAGMPRLVRDTALAQGKRVELQVTGAEVEISKAVLDRLMEPLIQLVKNAIAHGLETPERRVARGKRPVGVVKISVSTGTASATICVEDDGEGVDSTRIREAIIVDKYVSRAEAETLSENRLLQFLFKPGFSTTERTDSISGRGVGLDIVAERIMQLRGTYRLENVTGRGFRFFLTVPVNLLWSSVLSVRSGKLETCLRLSDISEALTLRASDVVHIDGNLCATLQGETLPLLPLSFIGGGDGEITFGIDGQVTALIIEYGERRAMFVIDELSGVSDVIIRTLPKPLGQLPGIAGYCILASGSPVCVLDGEFIVNAAFEHNASGHVRHVQPTAKRSLLIVEDSLTTRTLLRNIMISAGYDVDTAVDGADGWLKAQEHSYDCIVSDIEMPNMNGWELCARVKREMRMADTPFVLITSLSKDEERRRGLELGADAYMVKGLFNEQELLETVERLVA
ncbi:MAG: response regulator [Candidatus Eremiobacteraeota bacterium]|nr:response regulator [Candidatus Eremiobacteraeota bacterium]